MKCPHCDGPLLAGEAHFKKAASDFALFGLGSGDLWLRKEAGGEELLLVSSEKTAAQFCAECGVAVIATERGRRSALVRERSHEKA